MRTTLPFANPSYTPQPHTNPSPEKLDTMRKESHTTYNINYHVVWIPKYRRHLLHEPRFREILEEIIRGHSEDHDWKIHAFQVQPDHIHLFLSVPPKDCVSYVAKILKGNTSIQLRRIFPDLTQKYQLGKHLWAKGFYAGTAGFITEEKVKRYIEEQIKHDRMHEWNLKHPKGKQGRLA